MPPAPRSLGEVIGVYAWGREIIEDAEDGEEGEEGEECGETFMVIDEEVVRPPRLNAPCPHARRTTNRTAGLSAAAAALFGAPAARP